jgi:hypothetical protein
MCAAGYPAGHAHVPACATQSAPSGGLGTHTVPPTQPDVVGDEGSPQIRAFSPSTGGANVVEASGTQVPDGAPPSSVKWTPPPHVSMLSRVQVVAMVWLAGKQLCVHRGSLKKLITGGPQLAPVTGPHAQEHWDGPASRPSKPSSM